MCKIYGLIPYIFFCTKVREVILAPSDAPRAPPERPSRGGGAFRPCTPESWRTAGVSRSGQADLAERGHKAPLYKEKINSCPKTYLNPKNPKTLRTLNK